MLHAFISIDMMRLYNISELTELQLRYYYLLGRKMTLNLDQAI
jgi:hypothetical protein